MSTGTSAIISDRYVPWTATQMNLWYPTLESDGVMLYMQLHLLARFPEGFERPGIIRLSYRQLSGTMAGWDHLRCRNTSASSTRQGCWMCTAPMGEFGRHSSTPCIRIHHMARPSTRHWSHITGRGRKRRPLSPSGPTRESVW